MKIEILDMNRIKPIVFCLLLFVTSRLLLVNRPAFAQGSCTWKMVAPPPDIECQVAVDNCETGYSPDVRSTGTSCTCDCISTMTIPRYEDIPEFAKSPLVRWRTIGEVFSEALKYIYIFAGLGVFIYLLLGGFELMTSGGDPAGISAGAGKIKNAILGFVIIFASYWLVQIIEVIFGMTIL